MRHNKDHNSPDSSQPQYVAMAEPITLIGRFQISNTFLAAVCATIIEVPSWLIPDCNTTVPKFTRLDISPMDYPF